MMLKTSSSCKHFLSYKRHHFWLRAQDVEVRSIKVILVRCLSSRLLVIVWAPKISSKFRMILLHPPTTCSPDNHEIWLTRAAILRSDKPQSEKYTTIESLSSEIHVLVSISSSYSRHRNNIKMQFVSEKPAEQCTYLNTMYLSMPQPVFHECIEN